MKSVKDTFININGSEEIETIDAASSRHTILSMKVLAFVTVSLPLFSFISCVLMAWLLHFEHATATHCGVANYLPSISAAIGAYSPEKYIWRIGIALHSTPRYLIAYLYRNRYKLSLSYNRDYDKVIDIIFVLNVFEISCLIGLSYVSSTDNYTFHKIYFIGFIVSALLYMILTLLISKELLRPQSPKSERKSLKFKAISLIVKILSFLFALYFFYRHNKYCEAGVYTLFCLFEYIVVLSNMAFHMTAYWDFKDNVFTFSSIS